ncbi:MAG: PEP-CTERM sorting domain-containing protein [Fimbriiglobus sp.]
MKNKTTRALWGLVLLVVVGSASSGQAFYFAGWPGSGIIEPPKLLGPQARSVQTSIDTEERIPRVPREPVSKTGEPDPPGPVPEPGTLCLAALGLGIVGLRIRRRCGAVAGRKSAPLR